MMWVRSAGRLFDIPTEITLKRPHLVAIITKSIKKLTRKLQFLNNLGIVTSWRSVIRQLVIRVIFAVFPHFICTRHYLSVHVLSFLLRFHFHEQVVIFFAAGHVFILLSLSLAFINQAFSSFISTALAKAVINILVHPQLGFHMSRARVRQAIISTALEAYTLLYVLRLSYLSF